jgi:hypothetical protein
MKWRAKLCEAAAAMKTYRYDLNAPTGKDVLWPMS